MSKIEKELKNKLNIVIYLLLLISILLILTGKEEYIDITTKWVVSIIIGLITTAISQSFVEKITGNILKKFFLTINIFNKEYSISLFVIVTVIVKIWLFK